MISAIASQVAGFGAGHWAVAAVIATLSTIATFASSRAGSLSPSAFAALLTVALTFLWSDPSAVIEHARTAGVSHLLPATYQELALWLLACAAGTASWAIASVVGLCVAAYEGI